MAPRRSMKPLMTMSTDSRLDAPMPAARTVGDANATATASGSAAAAAPQSVAAKSAKLPLSAHAEKMMALCWRG